MEEKTVQIYEAQLLGSLLSQTSPETPHYSKHSKGSLVVCKISTVRFLAVKLNLI